MVFESTLQVCKSAGCDTLFLTLVILGKYYGILLIIAFNISNPLSDARRMKARILKSRIAKQSDVALNHRLAPQIDYEIEILGKVLESDRLKTYKVFSSKPPLSNGSVVDVNIESGNPQAQESTRGLADKLAVIRKPLVITTCLLITEILAFKAIEKNSVDAVITELLSGMELSRYGRIHYCYGAMGLAVICYAAHVSIGLVNKLISIKGRVRELELTLQVYLALAFVGGLLIAAVRHILDFA
jgi:hypothetical protein